MDVQLADSGRLEAEENNKAQQSVDGEAKLIIENRRKSKLRN